MTSKAVISSVVILIIALTVAACTIIFFYVFQNLETNSQQSAKLLPIKNHPQNWSVTEENGEKVLPGILVFHEDFDNFNNTIWKHVTGDANNTFYYYVDDKNNTFVRDGKLFIKPTFTSDKFGENYLHNGKLLDEVPSEKCLNQKYDQPCKKSSKYPDIVQPIISALITSKNAFRFKYGRLVVRAKMPSGDWIKPIINLKPHNKDGPLTPEIEINLTETAGNKELFNSNNEQVGSERNCPDVRLGTKAISNGLSECHKTEKDQGFDTKFSDYELFWTPDSIQLKIDGECLFEYPPASSMIDFTEDTEMKSTSSNKNMAPFDTDFYLEIGLSVGGTSGFFDDSYTGPYPKPWMNNDTAAAKTFWEKRENWNKSWQNESSALQIESIKLWSLNMTLSEF